MPGLISATKWVPRGVAAEFPSHVELDDEEAARVSELARVQLDNAQFDLEEAKKGAGEVDQDEKSEDDVNSEDESEDLENETNEKNQMADEMADLHMEDYDKEPENTILEAVANVRGHAFHAPDEKDEFLVDATTEEKEEEQEELRVLAGDNLVLAARTEDDVSYLEVHVFNPNISSDRGEALYVHHDIMLPSFPLCVEWVPWTPGSSTNAGNYAAVGSFDPEIELWDLDVVDSVYPNSVLGRKPEGASVEPLGTGKKKKRLKRANPEYHVDAVLSLSSNPNNVCVLASASADTTVKLWDLRSEKCASSLGHHTSKASTVAWNPAEATVLASGGYDRRAFIVDARSNETSSILLSSDVEKVLWHPSEAAHLFVSTENGDVCKYDVRNTARAVWTLKAHSGEVGSFDIGPHAPQLMVTGSSDKQVKLWNLAADKPSMLLSRDLDVGKVFSVQFAPEEGSLGTVAVGGSEGRLKIWNVLSSRLVRDTVGVETSAIPEVVSVPEGDEDEEDEE